MYSVNHPRSFVLADVALAAARTIGLWTSATAPAFAGMPDHLAPWVVYPVFPEIAERLGKVGDTRFKMAGDLNGPLISLDDFVERTFASYDAEDAAGWIVSPRVVASQETIARLVERPNVEVPSARSSVFAEGLVPT